MPLITDELAAMMIDNPWFPFSTIGMPLQGTLSRYGQYI